MVPPGSTDPSLAKVEPIIDAGGMSVIMRKGKIALHS